VILGNSDRGTERELQRVNNLCNILKNLMQDFYVKISTDNKVYDQFVFSLSSFIIFYFSSS
jgi:hypothetical protein